VAFTVILVACHDFRLSPWYCVTAVKISVLCVISAFERSLMYTRKWCCGIETHDAVVKFVSYRNLRRHRAVLSAIARLIFSVRFVATKVYEKQTGSCRLRTRCSNFYRQTDIQTDGRYHNANSRSHCVAVRSAKKSVWSDFFNRTPKMSEYVS